LTVVANLGIGSKREAANCPLEHKLTSHRLTY
jgi:hypothetical protein